MKKYRVRIDGQEYIVEVEEIEGENERASSSPDGSVSPVRRKDLNTEQSAPHRENKREENYKSTGSKGEITAPMPGKIIDIQVQKGEQVNQGDILLILEAMKMENNITAPFSGKIERVNVAKGTSVEAGEVLVKLE
ncbi:MAG: acetyl-CoA carboxylase biotin carboxyl carrier protein subunit [Halanaerobiales bacterium]